MTTSRSASLTTDEQLAAVRARRGHVMAHHRVLAALMPDLLDNYEQLYGAIDFTRRTLSEIEKGFVWMVVVAAGRIPIGGHHVRDFVAAGGSPTQIEAAAMLGAIAIGSPTLDTIAPGWGQIVPGLDLERGYRRSLQAIAESARLTPELLEISMTAAHACCRSWNSVRRHIGSAYAAGAREHALAEALTVTILPTGTPTFVQACNIWLKMVQSGEIRGSEALQHVAATL